MNAKRVAILGSTSHIAKGIIHNFLQTEGIELHLFSTSVDKLRLFLAGEPAAENRNLAIHEGYHEFRNHTYEVLINCVGVGTLNKLNGNFSNYFTVCETYDNLTLSYLRDKRPETLYIGFSSGAVYGRNHSAPFEDGTCACIPVNHLQKEDYYGITRLYSEAKHRSFTGLNIVDLRIFSYFSRFNDLSDGYFITEIMDCILNNKQMITNGHRMVRDYLHPDDLFAMILACMQSHALNAAFDVVSASPVDKFELLDFFANEYGLKYVVSDVYCGNSATGTKNVYCSRYGAAVEVGYAPKYSSMDTVKQEAGCLLSRLRG
jgi:nucleoside-diphosphate-sugar epimerase